MDLEEGKPIELSDKSLFDKYLKDYYPEISELTFTNLFIWKEYYNFKFIEQNSHIFVFSDEIYNKGKKPMNGSKDCIFFLPPIGPTPEKEIIKMFQFIKHLEFHRIPNKIINKLQENDLFISSNLSYIEDRDNWDYVYETNALINLPGNKYRQKRRWLNKFIEQNDFEFKIISEAMVEKVRQLQLDWCDVSECQSNEDLSQEQIAIDYAFKNYNELEIKGGSLFVNGKCIAYTLGEMLNDNTIVIHIEKAHAKYEGSYQAINNLFLNEYFKDIMYVNREQDLGIPGLRRAKEAYKPIKMIEKSIIYRRI